MSLGLQGELGLDAIAECVGASKSSVIRRFDACRDGGLADLLKRSSGKGAAPMLDASAQDSLRPAVRENTFRRADDARAWISQNLGGEISLSSTYRFPGKSSRG